MAVKMERPDFMSDVLHRIALGECYREAAKSPDPSTQVGAVLVKPGHPHYLARSCNRFTAGWKPTALDFERPRKYSMVEHAERNAIFTAAREGISTKGCTLYTTWAACAECARAIVESGITRLVRHYPPLDEATERWLASVTLGDQILKAGGIDIVDILGKIPEGVPILRGGEFFDPAT
jgi:dCMP deaminase